MEENERRLVNLVGTDCDVVVIKVHDESRNIQREFACERKRLLEEMKYFEEYLSPSKNCSIDDENSELKSHPQVEISVHCDVFVFEWLVRWIHFPQEIALEMNTVVSILISSDFLKMDALVNECLQFIAKHMNEILKLPIDLGCISEVLVSKLAHLLDAHALSMLSERRNVLLPRLYKRRLEIDFQHHSVESIQKNNIFLQRCQYCDRLYPQNKASALHCKAAPMRIDRHGSLLQIHAPLSLNKWSLTEYVTTLHTRNFEPLSWAQIYWLFWGYSHIFSCHICGVAFSADQINTCHFHPLSPSHDDPGIYPCCGQAVDHTFEISYTIPSGCKTKYHSIADQDIPEHEVLQRQAQIILAAAAKQHQGGILQQQKEKQPQQNSTVEKQQISNPTVEKQQISTKKKSNNRPLTTRTSSLSGKDRTKTSRRNTRSARPQPSKTENMTSFPVEKDSDTPETTQPQPSPKQLRPEHSVFWKTLTDSRNENSLDFSLLFGEPPRPKPPTHRLWDFDCACRDEDLTRLKNIEAALQALRKPWYEDQRKSTTISDDTNGDRTNINSRPHHRPTSSLGGSSDFAADSIKRRWR